MSEQIMVSVFVVAYNEERYIRQALDSILDQKVNFKYEVIVHDDASTDKTSDIVKEYERKHPGIVKGIYQDSNKYQKGIQFVVGYMYPAAAGKYIAYCDGDDYWTDPYKLQKQADFLESNPEYTMCQHAFSFLYEDKKEIKANHTYSGDQDMCIDEFIQWDGLKVPQIGTWMFRRDLAANRPKLFHMIAIEGVMSISDRPLAIYLALQGKVRYMDEVMSVWRRHSKTMFTRYTEKRMVAFQTSTIAFLEQLERYCGGTHEGIIKNTIEKEKFRRDIYLENYAKVIQSRFFCELPLMTKCRVLLGSISPKLVNKIRMIKHNHAGK